ncbi:MAG: hypothetical protein LQ340_002224 [Diploschistes diacapsis]|nr:MAG: hypothetical protein LQ340_002224 [Diploschistes diacapsis]
MAEESQNLPQWYRDLTTPPSKPKSTANIPDPPGFSSSTKRSASKQPARKPPTTEETDQLKLKKAWEVAIAPAKSLPMNAVMMYMSGNGLQIFSIMMVFMLFKSPAQALMQTNQAFVRFDSAGTRGKLVLVKAVYVLTNLVALALGLWKVNGMGLLP